MGETVVDKSDDVVIRLFSSLLGCGYHMFTNNYFTSIPLDMYLYIQRTYLTGRGLVELGCWSQSNES